MIKKTKKSKISNLRHSFSWMNPKLEARETKKYGRGIFAKKNISKDEILAIFGGYVMKVSDEQNLSGNLSDYSLQISENYVIGPAYQSEIRSSEFFNHSCNPNAGFKGQIFLVAMRKIKKNEQVTFDYAMVLHKSKNAKMYKMNCLCGSKNCRKIITENDWKIPMLQKKYKGYFQFYLQEKIDKINKK